jgi:hypothetical protein
MSSVSRGEQMVLAGPPYKLKAVVHLAAISEKIVVIKLHIAGEPSLHRAYIRPLGKGASEIRLKLPHDTPAGTYRGEATLGGETHAIVLHVTPSIRTRVNPRQTLVTVEPGGRAEFTIEVSNNGNTALELPKARLLDLDDEEGQDRALGKSLRAGLGAGESRVERFFEELRVSHGGEARVTLVEGTGALEPGESRKVRCQVEVPMTAQPGRSYVGGWDIGNASHLLAVEVTSPGPRESGRKTG